MTMFLLVVIVGTSNLFAADPRPIDFRREIQPILSSRCFQCHGPDESHRKGDLRLDTPEFLKKSDSPVIRLGNSKSSPLIHRIISTNADERMPPLESNRTLSPTEIDLLVRWIDEGAVWMSHWSFEPIRRLNVPTTMMDIDSRSPVDSFIRDRLNSAGISPSPEADKFTLLRRVSLDLIGLPPKQYEIEEFFDDVRVDSFERCVDRLLASPHYGEKWGRHWLDVARYADSTGFETDAPKPLWKYRDWVIDAVNSDMPFDRFVVAQIAGDQLPEASTSDRIATAFVL
ncbi:MAG: DUF1549 domain-containing protein, partial [Planctomycetes bacterium]|nr:DUF1549 domain-containing protein [Planctomycetota bacterium]